MNSGGALRANPGAVLCGLTMKSLVELRASIQAHLDALPPGEEPEPWAMPVVRPDVRIVHVPYNVVCENTLDVPRKRRRR